MSSTTLYDSFFLHFGLRENPFHVSPNLHFYHSSPQHDSALAELTFGIETRKGFLVITGEAGTGKTTLLNHLLDWLRHTRKSSAYVFHSQLDPTELSECILRDFSIPCPSPRKADILHALRQWLIARHAAGDSPVVIIDEAQSLSIRTLDALRLLLNLELPTGKLVQIVLAGQPELGEKLARRELRQLHQRIMVRCTLTPLTLAETNAYLRSRLAGAGVSDHSIFPAESVSAIHAYSGGIPRIINLLCEQGLIGAFADQKHFVSIEHIQRVAADFDLTAAVTTSRLPAITVVDSIFPAPDFEISLADVAQKQNPSAVAGVSPAGPMFNTILEQSIPLEPTSSPVLREPIPEAMAIPVATEKPQHRRRVWRLQRHRSRIYLLLSALPAAFYDYWTGVLHSFLHDWNRWVHSASPRRLATPESVARAHPTSPSPHRQNALAPVAKWLRKPISPSPRPQMNRDSRETQ